MEIVVQKIEKSYSTPFEKAKVYYSIMFQLNNIKVTNCEIELVAYSAVYGTFSTPPVRDQFIEDFNTSKSSVYNMLSKLQKLHIIKKDKDKKYRINPSIQLDFSKPLLLNIKLNGDPISEQ